MSLAVVQKMTAEKTMMTALEGKVTKNVPFWLMRQAGRYLPEYRELRQKAGSFLDLCMNPEFACEVTVQPLRRFDMDAAILFSDILIVPHALGQKLDFVEGEGPKLGAFTPDKLDFSAFEKKTAPIYETVRRVRAELDNDKTLIGFAGAPWTVACYMIEGRGNKTFPAAREFALNNGAAFDELIGLLVQATARYLSAQIAAGADVVQIFDSWAGLAPKEHFERWVIEPTRKIADLVRKEHSGAKIIGFPREAGASYKDYAAKAGIDGIGLDQSVDLASAIRDFGGKVCLQGNLAPEILLAGGKALEEETLRILNAMRGQPFIFNLGHGVIKETPPEHVAALSKIIRSFEW